MTKRPSNPGEGHTDLEVKDVNLIFLGVWNELELSHGRSNLRFPKEIIWLGGAPGAGKGTNTPFIQEERGFTASPIVVSDLLDSDEARKIKDAGGMVGDREVIKILFNKLLHKEFNSGVIVDGFPRTQVQVECLKLFYRKMIDLKNEFHNTELDSYFRYPLFRITVLFVEERTSVERQLNRGREAQEHNLLAKKEGGASVEIRKTDLDEKLARRRYQTFKEQTFEALKSLKTLFHYHFIQADGTINEVQWNIAKEFKYQSSLELDHDIFEAMRYIPLASEILVHTRQELVKRLEEYFNNHEDIFRQIVKLIDQSFMPRIRMHSNSGYVLINSENDLLSNKLAVDILVDILSERGFNSSVDLQEKYIPRRVNPETHEIECEIKKRYAVHIRFKGSQIRRGN